MSFLRFPYEEMFGTRGESEGKNCVRASENFCWRANLYGAGSFLLIRKQCWVPCIVAYNDVLCAMYNALTVYTLIALFEAGTVFLPNGSPSEKILARENTGLTPWVLGIARQKR
jgi:hypothetical protein